MSHAQIERAVQTEIMLRLRAGAWPVIARMKADGMLVPGAPDLVLLWAGGGAMVELKRPKVRDLFDTRPAGRPSEAQATIATRAAHLGVQHAYCSSWNDLRTRLVEWGGGHAA